MSGFCLTIAIPILCWGEIVAGSEKSAEIIGVVDACSCRNLSRALLVQAQQIAGAFQSLSNQVVVGCFPGMLEEKLPQVIRVDREIPGGSRYGQRF